MTVAKDGDSLPTPSNSIPPMGRVFPDVSLLKSPDKGGEGKVDGSVHDLGVKMGEIGGNLGRIRKEGEGSVSSRIHSFPQTQASPTKGGALSPLAFPPASQFPRMHGTPMLGLAACPAVMVVDDSTEVTNALSRVLDAKGYRALPFFNSADALAWLEVNHRLDPPAVVLVDVHLPDGSGIDLARRARDLLGDDIPVVVVSGDTSIENLRLLPDSGATLFVAKPFHVPTLLTKLRTWANGIASTL
jgi:CheY-like chemotaxis protein